ncbi:MAG: single-stranded-DNA-specific exonuclease [Caudoviricetes sp.]|nr:MAG: single-stranded-DNA-specific exonuclease [Caudoviricetes sp.]
MKYKLIKPINPKYSAIEQILANRGVDYKDIPHYLNTTDNDINDFDLLGHKNLENAARELIYVINNNKKACVIVDCDVDGYTASASMINYLYSLFPSWVTNRLKWIHHQGKSHGLNDLLDEIISEKYSLVLAIDCGTNDLKEHSILRKNGCEIIVLDHHIQEDVSKDAIIINNQCSDYPNKHLCGCGIVWQFCRYLDSILRINNSNNYLDLVALALTADMMSLLSIETRHLITKGFQSQNIHNPFILYMWKKNKFKLGDEITSWGAAFYIVPLLNAITRSGTLEEKEIVFTSLINHLALKEVPSTKRGHSWGDMETIADQAIRICDRVKRRQTKSVLQGMEILEERIEKDNMMENKVLLFLNNNQEVDKNIAGWVTCP